MIIHMHAFAVLTDSYVRPLKMLNTQIKLHLKMEKQMKNMINHIIFAQIIFYSFLSTLKTHAHEHKKKMSRLYI